MGIDYTVYMLVQSSNIKSLERLSGHRFTHAARALWQQKYEKNCIHSIKYKYLTETMYLWYLLISNIETGKKIWLEGRNQKLPIYVNAMYLQTHTQFRCKLFYIILDFDCGSLFLLFSWDFIFPFQCVHTLTYSLSYELYFLYFRSVSLCWTVWFQFFSIRPTFIFITNCRQYSFRHV